MTFKPLKQFKTSKGAQSFDSGFCSAVLRRFERFARLEQLKRLIQDLLGEFRRRKPDPVVFVF
jgi:hypothetical protein